LELQPHQVVHLFLRTVSPRSITWRKTSHTPTNGRWRRLARQVKLEYCTEPKLASESICNALMRKAKELKLDFVALGVYGNLEENKSLYVPSCGGAAGMPARATAANAEWTGEVV
jgi:hypothetical protein